MNSVETYENKNVAFKKIIIFSSEASIKSSNDEEMIKNKITNFEIIDSSVKTETTNCFVANFNKVLKATLIKSCWLINNKVANKILIFLIISISCWLFAFILVGDKGLPGGNVFSLAVLYISANSVGFLFEKIKIPSLLGNIVLLNILLRFNLKTLKTFQ